MVDETKKVKAASGDGPQPREDPVVIDDTDKAFNLALQACDLSARLMSTLRTFVNVAKISESSGITFAERDFSGTSLKYCLGSDVQTALANATALLTYLETNFIDDVFDKVTKG